MQEESIDRIEYNEYVCVECGGVRAIESHKLRLLLFCERCNERCFHMFRSARCKATITIKDECSIMPWDCEKEVGHSGNHLCRYPGQWGEVRILVRWEGEEESVEFHRNKRVR